MDRLLQSGLKEAKVVGEEQRQSEEATMRADKEQFIRGTFSTNPEKGLELLFREYYRPLCSHAMRIVFSTELAKDIVAEVFCNFLQREHYKKVQSSYKFYLYRSVRNDCLKYLRDEMGRPLQNLEDTNELETAHSETPESLIAYDELSVKIGITIANLPPQTQKVFLMNRYEGKKQQEIADEFNVSLKAIEAHITKALKAIRRAIQGGWL